MLEHVVSRRAAMLFAVLAASLPACALEVDAVESDPSEPGASHQELSAAKTWRYLPLNSQTTIYAHDTIAGCAFSVTHGYFGKASVSSAYTSNCRCQVTVYSHVAYPYGQKLTKASDVPKSCSEWNQVTVPPGYGGPTLYATTVSLYNGITRVRENIGFSVFP